MGMSGFILISIIIFLGLGLTTSGASDGHTNHYEPMMEPPGVHFDSNNYSVLSAMDTQSSGMLQQNFDAHVCVHATPIHHSFRLHPSHVFFCCCSLARFSLLISCVRRTDVRFHLDEG